VYAFFEGKKDPAKHAAHRAFAVRASEEAQPAHR
jgi:hypothetical protein